MEETQPKSKLEQLKEKLAQEQLPPTPEQQIADLTDTLKRLQADFANYRRRTEEETGSIKKRVSETLLKEMLSINDNLETALKHVPKDQQNEFYKGVKMIQQMIISTMESHGMQRIPHEKFDVNLHEAITTEASDKPKDTIIEVLHQGYLLAGKVLRPSKVKVSSGGK
ncbi:MAG TPA: nucleotide exchange factor GrpE [Candidatus Nanoarchaeia archaeon]|nr:nucleotide exchange factor GrpE [Candidatus Nanoarchaeia archaeon]